MDNILYCTFNQCLGFFFIICITSWRCTRAVVAILLFQWAAQEDFEDSARPPETAAQKPEKILVSVECSLSYHHCWTDWVKKCNYVKHGQVVGVCPVSNCPAWVFLPSVLEGICVTSSWWISLEAFMIWACIMYVPGYMWIPYNTWLVPQKVLYSFIKFSVSSRNLAPRITDDETWRTAINVQPAWSWEGSYSSAGFAIVCPI